MASSFTLWQDTADSFAQARHAGCGMEAWPGRFPCSLEEAYLLQQATQAVWGKAAGGVKVGRVLGGWQARFGVDRFTGPVDADAIRFALAGQDAVFPVIAGGTALLECEIVAVLGNDGPDAAVSPEQASALVDCLHIGIEVAGSPLADINALGPLASIACFGNNNGAILGRKITNWQVLDLTALPCTASIDGVQVGHGDTSRLPGGIWAAVAFALTQSARIGQPLHKGDIICTGALTGMHPVVTGQQVEADFGALGTVRCRVADQPRPATPDAT